MPRRGGWIVQHSQSNEAGEEVRLGTRFVRCLSVRINHRIGGFGVAVAQQLACQTVALRPERGHVAGICGMNQKRGGRRILVRTLQRPRSVQRQARIALLCRRQCRCQRLGLGIGALGRKPGLGCSMMPFRLGVPPEIVLVTLGGSEPAIS